MTGRLRANEKVNYIGQTTFTIDRNYTDFKLIGKGSYGVVCSAHDNKQNERIAIKKITPIFRDIDDAKHVIREIRLMKHMGKHDNIITLHDLIIRENNDELYIIMELLDSDLHRVIQSSQVLTNGHLRHFLFQLLCGVKYLHDNNIIHRDLKPGNLLVSRDCKLRITDFGLARQVPRSGVSGNKSIGDDIDIPMTEHVVTRWYRPPELMLCPDGLYSYSVDMWSCGCIFAEMLLRRPLFPGKNFIDQLTLIFNIIGSPKYSHINHITNHQAKKYLETQKGKKRVDFKTLFSSNMISKEAIQVVDSLLIFHPNDRLTCDETLLLPYFDNMPNSKSMIFPKTSSNFEFEYENNKKLTKNHLRQLILNEVASIKKENNNNNKRNQKSKAYDVVNPTKKDVDDDGEEDDDGKSKISAHSASTAQTKRQHHNERSTSTGRSGVTRKPAVPTRTVASSNMNDSNKRSISAPRPGRQTRKAPIPPYKKNATQRPSIPVASSNIDVKRASAAIIDNDEIVNDYRNPIPRNPPIPLEKTRPIPTDYQDVDKPKSSGYATRRVPQQEPMYKPNIREDVDDEDEPEQESKDYDPYETFGKVHEDPNEDLTAARNFIKTPNQTSTTRVIARPVSGNMATLDVSRTGKESNVDGGYETPDENDGSGSNKKPIILNSPSRLNKTACDKLNDERYSHKAMEILQRTATTAQHSGKKGRIIEEDVDDEDVVVDDDDDVEDDDSDEEDIVAKMYRLYGKKDADEEPNNRPKGRIGSRPVSAAITRTTMEVKDNNLDQLRRNNYTNYSSTVPVDSGPDDDDDEIEPPSQPKIYSRPVSGHNLHTGLNNGDVMDDNSDVGDTSIRRYSEYDVLARSKNPIGERNGISGRYDDVREHKVASVGLYNNNDADIHKNSVPNRLDVTNKKQFLDNSADAKDDDIYNTRREGKDSQNYQQYKGQRGDPSKLQKVQKKKSNVTVPQSPQFSKMSWQRHREAKHYPHDSRPDHHHSRGTTAPVNNNSRPTIPDRYSRKGPPMSTLNAVEQEQTRKGRASSAPRVRPSQQQYNVDQHNVGTARQQPPLNKHGRGYAAPTASALGRSASSGRMGLRR